MKLNFFEKYFEFFEKKKLKTVRGIIFMNMYSKFHYDRKDEKHLQLGAKNDAINDT